MLRFGSNGKFRVMHITDTHIQNENAEASLFLIEEAVRREMPDIVIITGDNVLNYDDENITKGYIERFMNIFEKYSVPSAVTFGNHDSETGALSRKELMRIYSSYPCHVADSDGKKPFAESSFNVPVMSSDGSKTVFNLWVFDSGDYDKEGHYGCMSEKDVQWYKSKCDELTVLHGGAAVPALAFQHIIVPEVYEALRMTKKRKLYSFRHMYNRDEYYMFSPDGINYGTLNETPCSGYENFGQFEAMAEKGDVLAVFSGHDHTNAFGVKYKGIDIMNSLSTRSESDRFSTQYGYRMIEIDEKYPAKYKTYVSRWYNMFTMKDIEALKQSGNSFGASVASCVKYRGLIQRFLTFTGRSFCRIVTGRKNTY